MRLPTGWKEVQSETPGFRRFENAEQNCYSEYKADGEGYFTDEYIEKDLLTVKTNVFPPK